MQRKLQHALGVGASTLAISSGAGASFGLRRVLATGVSGIALAMLPTGVVHATPGKLQTASAPSVDLDLELSNIAGGPVFGLSGPTPIVIDSVADGLIRQVGTSTGPNGTADLAITNSGNVTILRSRPMGVVILRSQLSPKGRCSNG